MTSAFPAPAGTPPPPRAIVGATLVDGTGGPPVANATIVLRGGKIDCAGRCEIPGGVSVVDGRGLWVTPGLVDAHVHFSQTGWADGRPDSLDVRDRHPYETVEADLKQHPERFFRSQLCSGVTSVFDVGGYAWTVAMAHRRARRPARASGRRRGTAAFDRGPLAEPARRETARLRARRGDRAQDGPVSRVARRGRGQGLVHRDSGTEGGRLCAGGARGGRGSAGCEAAADRPRDRAGGGKGRAPRGRPLSRSQRQRQAGRRRVPGAREEERDHLLSDADGRPGVRADVRGGPLTAAAPSVDDPERLRRRRRRSAKIAESSVGDSTGGLREAGLPTGRRAERRGARCRTGEPEARRGRRHPDRDGHGRR